MDTDSFIVYIKTENIYKDIAEDVETRFDNSNYEWEGNCIDRTLSKEKNEKVIGLMQGELGGKIMTKFVEIRSKLYSYLLDESSEDKKPKGTKKCVIKRKLELENYKNYLEDNKMKYLEKK